MKEALGLVEIRGMSTAIEVADAMVKCANVRIIGMENTRGLGYMTIKVAGDVGAVTASVEAGKKMGLLYDKLISYKVIPRPSDGMAAIFCKEKEAEKLPKQKKKAKSEKKKAPKSKSTNLAVLPEKEVKEETKTEETKIEQTQEPTNNQQDQ